MTLGEVEAAIWARTTILLHGSPAARGQAMDAILAAVCGYAESRYGVIAADRRAELARAVRSAGVRTGKGKP